MKTLQGKASDILYDLTEGLYTKVNNEKGEYFLIDVETGIEYSVNEDVQFYLKIIDQHDH
jgi:hypothetical protein